MKKEKSKYINVELKTKEENFVLLSTKNNIYDLYVKEFDDNEVGHANILNKLKKLNDKDTLNIHISSIGGGSYLLINYINILQRTTANVNAFLNYGYSSGALLFGACNNRFHYEYSELMYHTFSHSLSGKSQEIISSINNSEKIMHKMIQKFYIGLTKAEFKKLTNGKDFWLNTDDMIKRNISELV